MTTLTLERHAYEGLGDDFYIAGYMFDAGPLRFGPFKTDQEAFSYAAVFKQLEPDAEIHLWPMLGITALKENPNG